MWLLQDLLSVAICLLFVQSIQLPSLRIATLFLSLFFAYDVFMVFLSPSIFHTSVMLAVATAGEPTESIDASGACQRTEGEPMPMLFRLPRLSEYSPPRSLAWRLSGAAGDFAMLGLGDVVLPALALALARRVDIALAHPHRLGYFECAVVAYAVGLALTLCANTYGWTINEVQGQPALMYLVPAVLGALFGRAILSRQLQQLWDGSILPDPKDEALLICDGCKAPQAKDDNVWSNRSQNLDFCTNCYEKLAIEERGSLAPMLAHGRSATAHASSIRSNASCLI
ncbi:hypothetical protein AB1Y20_005689 [Prymnesium parvum]